MVNKILFITLSNIGDVILTLPTLDYLKGNFPSAKITVMVGPRPQDIFRNNPNIDKLIIYDKHAKLKDKISLFLRFKAERFDLVVDLRNSLFGALLSAKHKLSASHSEKTMHMKDRHFSKLPPLNTKNKKGSCFYVSPQDGEYIEDILKKNNITAQDRLFVIAAGARSSLKRWPKDKFLELISSLSGEFAGKVVLAGDKDDLAVTKYITGHSRSSVMDLTGKTTLGQLAYLLKRSDLLIANDSAILHLASYFNRPVVAIFGPTNELKYGPWSDLSAVVKKEISCRPCSKAQCKSGTLECVQLIKVEDVLRQVRNILGFRVQGSPPKAGPPTAEGVRHKADFKRILIVRTDRIGDVILSTPVIQALRQTYPDSYIAMMVSPYAKDIVEGNPYLDQVIIYDKDAKHKSWQRSMKFALNLKKKKFDLALVLHPINRAHLVTFFAGIPKRVGYDRKFGFLLTDRIEHTKQSGQKHESEYALDLVRYLGIEPKDTSLFIPIKPESEEWAAGFLKEKGIKGSDRLLAIHPGASCISKVWPLERFAEAADKLADKYGFKVLIIAGPKDMFRAEQVLKNMRHSAFNLAGKTSVSQLSSILKRCHLFISNDSGPVHIASGLGVPVISIFGRSQPGLGPLRWGPVGKQSCYAHKAAGCVECLAHNCIRDFVCLKAVTVDYVINLADSILRDQ